jgi:DNA-binding MarR family transcriptional regulator
MQSSSVLDEPNGDTEVTPSHQLLRSLLTVQGWFRETSRQVIPHHSGASLALLVLLEGQGPLRARELAEISRVDPSVISRQVAALVADGLVDRVADPDDRRAQLLSLSPEGATVLSRGRRAMLAVVEERLSGWDPDELRASADQLARLIADLSTPRTP